MALDTRDDSDSALLKPPSREISIGEIPRILRERGPQILQPQVDLKLDASLITAGSDVTVYYVDAAHHSQFGLYHFAGKSSTGSSVDVACMTDGLTVRFSTVPGDNCIPTSTTFSWPFTPSIKKTSRDLGVDDVGDTEVAIYAATQELLNRVKAPNGEFQSLSHVREACGILNKRLAHYKESHECPPNSVAAESEMLLASIPNAFLGRRGDIFQLQGFVRKLTDLVERGEIKTLHALDREENGMLAWLNHLLEMTDPHASTGSRSFAVDLRIVLDDLNRLREQVIYEEDPAHKVSFRDHLAARRRHQPAQPAQPNESSQLQGPSVMSYDTFSFLAGVFQD